LLDPSENVLVRALEQASAAGGRKRLGRTPWEPILAEIAEHSEGRLQEEYLQANSSVIRYVSVAWWTDHQGRKHIRVAGGDSLASGWQPHHTPLDEDLRPPLWHIAPERVYRVARRGQEPAWIVSCACGVTGDPRSLAWMGPRCGPCHDRVEEGQPHPDEATPALFAFGAQSIHAATFSPDSRRLAVASSSRCIDLLSLEGKPRARLLSPEDASEEDEFRTLLFSRDARFLAAGDPDEWVVLVWDLEGDNGQELDLETVTDGQIVALAFSPIENLLVVCTEDGVLNAWRLQEDATWRTLHDRRRQGTALAFSLNGQRLAVGRRHGFIDLIDPVTWKRRWCIPSHFKPIEDVLFLQFAPDDRLVVLTGSQSAEHAHLGHQLHLRNLADKYREIATHHIPPIAAIGSSHDGRYLAWVVHDQQHSPGEITLWDVQAWQEIGRLEWNPEDPLHCIDFSPDGQTLVTGSADGVVKLWPWRLLLGC
jgi:WD40 repeat protein